MIYVNSFLSLCFMELKHSTKLIASMHCCRFSPVGCYDLLQAVSGINEVYIWEFTGAQQNGVLKWAQGLKFSGRTY